MGRKITLVCDLCGKEIEAVAAKLYLAPILPNKHITSFQSQYSHSGDICSECVVELSGKLNKRKPRTRNGKVTPIESKRRKTTSRRTA